jgi:tetratricopeptide (TPR) repeat protein
MKKWYIIITIVLQQSAVAQSANSNFQDSLLSKSYQYLSNKVLSNNNEKRTALIYANALLKKSKLEKDWIQMTYAYKSIMFLKDKKLLVNYADSLLVAAKKSNDNAIIGAAFLTKGIIQYNQKDLKKALDNYLIADKYLIKTDDDYTIYKVKYSIAHTKYYLGFYDEAISLFRECIEYFKDQNDRAYLNSIHSLGLCYNKIGNYAWCTINNQLGIDEGKRLDNFEMEYYFVHSEGVNLWYRNKYYLSIKNLTFVLPMLIEKGDFANEAVAYFYIGKSFWSLKQEDKAIIYFKKVDEIVKKEKYCRPDLREGYEKLIHYSKRNNDTKSQLYYINQLLEVDKILSQNYNYLLKKVVKEYDTKELLRSKYEIENTMTFRTIGAISVIGILMSIIAFLIYKHFKNKRLFDEIMKRDNTPENRQKTPTKPSTSDLNATLEATILKNLEKFEKNKKYLDKDMTLTKMASVLNTNTKYVTKVIAKYREKGTIEYLTDLKINYIIEKLKTEH